MTACRILRVTTPQPNHAGPLVLTAACGWTCLLPQGDTWTAVHPAWRAWQDHACLPASTAALGPDLPTPPGGIGGSLADGEPGVLLWSGLVCPAASSAVAEEQAALVGGIACLTPAAAP